MLDFNVDFIHSICIETLVLLPLKPYGPHILPKFLTEPVRVYKPNLDRNVIGKENKNCTIIYQWVNLINGKIYIGSAWKGSVRLFSYWAPSTLQRNLPIYNSLLYYTHNNFALAILENLGKTGSVTKEYMLSREQYYLDIIFNSLPSLPKKGDGSCRIEKNNSFFPDSLDRRSCSEGGREIKI